MRPAILLAIAVLATGCNTCTPFVSLEGATTYAAGPLGKDGAEICIAPFTDGRRDPSIAGRMVTQDIRLDGNAAQILSTLLTDTLRRSGVNARLGQSKASTVRGRLVRLELIRRMRTPDMGEIDAVIAVHLTIEKNGSRRDIGLVVGQATIRYLWPEFNFHANRALHAAAADWTKEGITAIVNAGALSE